MRAVFQLNKHLPRLLQAEQLLERALGTKQRKQPVLPQQTCHRLIDKYPQFIGGRCPLFLFDSAASQLWAPIV